MAHTYGCTKSHMHAQYTCVHICINTFTHVHAHHSHTPYVYHAHTSTHIIHICIGTQLHVHITHVFTIHIHLCSYMYTYPPHMYTHTHYNHTHTHEHTSYMPPHTQGDSLNTGISCLSARGHQTCFSVYPWSLILSSAIY